MGQRPQKLLQRYWQPFGGLLSLFPDINKELNIGERQTTKLQREES